MVLPVVHRAFTRFYHGVHLSHVLYHICDTDIRDSASSPGRNTGALDCDYLGYRRYVLLHLENLKIIHDTEGRHSRMPTVDGGPNDDIGTDMEENAPALVIEISDAFNSNFMKNHTGITSLPASEEKDPLLLVDFGLDLESIGPIVHPYLNSPTDEYFMADDDTSTYKEGIHTTEDHAVYRCNICNSVIKDFRYTCVQCSDYDLCGACEARQAHDTHYVLRIPGPRTHGEVSAMLHTIRRALLSDAFVHVADEPRWATGGAPGGLHQSCKHPASYRKPPFYPVLSRTISQAYYTIQQASCTKPQMPRIWEGFEIKQEEEDLEDPINIENTEPTQDNIVETDPNESIFDPNYSLVSSIETEQNTELESQNEQIEDTNPNDNHRNSLSRVLEQKDYVPRTLQQKENVPKTLKQKYHPSRTLEQTDYVRISLQQSSTAKKIIQQKCAPPKIKKPIILQRRNIIKPVVNTSKEQDSSKNIESISKSTPSKRSIAQSIAEEYSKKMKIKEIELLPVPDDVLRQLEGKARVNTHKLTSTHTSLISHAKNSSDSVQSGVANRGTNGSTLDCVFLPHCFVDEEGYTGRIQEASTSPQSTAIMWQLALGGTVSAASTKLYSPAKK
ncbi:zinc finger, ZZ type domain-containing protein [Phthorimaea operculella]|nr:zinc finger, ZZ type domain-containing protein [Phthorimaea operculella]